MNENNMNADLESSQEKDVVTHEDLSSLVERMDTLEGTVNHITEKQGTLIHTLREFTDSIEEIQDIVDNLKEEVDDLSKDSTIQESRLNSINRSLDYIEEDLEDNKGNLQHETSKLSRRLTAIEDMLNLDELDIAQAVKPDACELEQLTTVPKQFREEEFDVRVQRAIVLYENFNDISEPIRNGGKRLLSKDAKTFLNGYSESNIAYTQVQRVIDSFDEKTGEEFKTRQTNDGRAIIWNPDK